MVEWTLGTVEAGADGTLAVRPDSMEGAPRKPCRVPAGVTLAPGQRALLCRYGGSFLVVAVYPGG